jgi:amino acid adenylation domain-containing protein
VASDSASIAQRLARLSPERRKALDRLLREKESSAPPALSIPRRAASDVVPLSFGQQRIWLLDQLAPGNPFYNETEIMRFQFMLNVPALERSIQEIVNRHEVLRTSFQVRNGQPVQVIAPSLTVPLEIVELRGLGEGERLTKALELAYAQACQPFVLATGALIRTKLYRLGESDSLLVISAHHIVCDGWSFGVFDFELTTLYEAFSHGYSSSLPPLPIQYGDFAVWQRDYLQGEEYERQLSYWREQLSGLPVLTLPTDRPRPLAQSYRGKRITCTVPAHLHRALDDLARSEGLTLFMILLAAFDALLYRLTGAGDIAVGVPLTNRRYENTEGLIGFFVNTLVMRCRVSGDTTVRELLDQTHKTVVGAFTHQDLPFERLVEELHPERDLGRNPLFQVVFQFFTAPSQYGVIPGRMVPIESLDNSTAKFDLRCDMILRADALVATFEYSTDLFEEPTIRRFIRHYFTLLEAMATRCSDPVGDLPLLNDDELRSILVDWNNTASAYPRDASVPELFRHQVDRSPDAPAGVEAGHEITYRELDLWSDVIAIRLQSAEVKPGSRVAICIPRSLSFIASALGVLKAGGTYVPFDPQTPARRLGLLLADSQAVAILTVADLGRGLANYGLPIVEVSALATAPGAGSMVPAAGNNGDSIAYVMYTSGSTGKPKGVEIPHRAITRLVVNTNYITLTPSDTVGMASNVAFDASTFEIWGALLNGSRVAVLSRDDVLSATELEARIDRDRITVLFLTTDLCHQHALENPRMFRSLRVLLFGGSRVDPHWVRNLLAVGPPTELLHVYGPTETTTFACFHRLHALAQDAVTIPIGRPISNTEAYILDTRMNPVPVGVAGNLYVGGDGLARGYLDNAELTTARFVRHPFAPAPSARLYQTGDIARYLADGNIEFIGRADHQIKIRGFRVELGEIETALLANESVREVVVAPAGDSPSNLRLIAYVVPNRQDRQAATTDLVDHWRAVYDSIIYAPCTPGSPEPEDPSFNITGWVSSFTYTPIPQEQMKEQVEGTVGRIRSLHPHRILEIGCGTGLLLFRIGPECDEYVGTDFSSVALDYLRRHLNDSKNKNIRLIQATADGIPLSAGRNFDTVILNSVVQYFPNIEYLRDVLTAVVDRMPSGGNIFLGDVRNLALLDALHSSIELNRAPDSMILDDLKQKIQRSTDSEQELVVHPSFFTSFAQHHPRITGIRMEPKRGRLQNELTCFRYDVFLEVDGPKRADQPAWRDWRREHLDLDALRRLLNTSDAPLLGFHHVPNARTVDGAALIDLLVGSDAPDTVLALRTCLAERRAGGIEPEDLIAVATETGRTACFSLSRGTPDGSFDVVFHRRDDSAANWMFSPQSFTETKGPHANAPVLRDTEDRLAAGLREYLRSTLPDYMVPSEFVTLDTLPLNANGKVDYQALPVPGHKRPGLQHGFVAPRTPLETVLSELWAEVLHLEQVGIDDSFFDLGGHSLLAMLLVSRIREALEVTLPLRRLFEMLTIARLAESMLLEADNAVALNRRAELLLTLSALSDADVEEQLAAVVKGES